jgi:hypothetical protein
LSKIVIQFCKHRIKNFKFPFFEGSKSIHLSGVEGCSLVAGSPNRAACPLLVAQLTTAAAFSILEAGGQQLSLDWSLGVESSCQELTVIPVTVVLHPSVNISLTQVSFAMYHTDSHIITQAKQSIRNLAVLVLSFKTPSLCLLHCKHTIPKILNKNPRKRDCAATVPISPFMCL